MSTAATPDVMAPTIQLALNLLVEPGRVVELRALGGRRGTVSGYFDDLKKMAEVAASLSGRCSGVYFTLNPVKAELLARANNWVREYVKQGEATGDTDIVCRVNFGIDFDPMRPSGISSNDAEHEAALSRAEQCIGWLRDLGWPDPIYADSGNGAHLVYRVNLPNNAAASGVLTRCLEALGLRFDDEVVAVDRTTFNASRIWKLYGTVAQKGDALPDRPYRVAAIIEAPENMEFVSVEMLERLAAMAPDPSRPRAGSGTSSDAWSDRGRGDYGTLDVVAWFETHGHYGRDLRGGKHAVLCPWEREHTDRTGAENSDTVVWEASGGRWPRFHCSHSHCIGRGIQEVIALWGDANRSCGDTYGGGPGTEDTTKDTGEEAQEPWEPPLPFVEAAGPPFPTGSLPEPVSYFVTAQSIALQVPEDLVGCLVLGAGAAAAAGRCVVRINTEWAEPLNIFIVVDLPSGERKSPAFRVVMAPLEERERELARAAESDIATAEAKTGIMEKRLQDVKARAAKAKSDDDRDKLTVEATELAAKLAAVTAPVSPRLLADDATPEAVASLLAQQEGRMAVVSTEGGLFETLAGRYSKGVLNIDVYLKGFSGDTLRVDRKSRPPEYVPNPALTLCLTVQPDVIRGLADKKGFRGRGLLARFLFSVPRSLVGYRETSPPPVPQELRRGWDRVIKSVLKIPDSSKDQEHAIFLSDEATEVFQRFRGRVEVQLRPGADLYEIQDWRNKFVGAVARIAGILHLLIHHADARPWELKVERSTIEAAICVGGYFASHAHVAFGLMGADPRVENARRLWATIRHHDHTTFSQRDLWQRVRRSYSVDELGDVLGILVKMGYLRQVSTARRAGRGRPASPTFEVNPLARMETDRKQSNSGYTSSESATGQEVQERQSEGSPINNSAPRTQNTQNSFDDDEVVGPTSEHPDSWDSPKGDWGEV